MTDYLLLTPGPHSTTETVKQAMLKDWCVIDSDFSEEIEQDVRQRLMRLSHHQEATTEITNNDYDTILLPGSSICGLEAVIGSAVCSDQKLLIINNGENGQHLVNIAKRLKIDHLEYNLSYEKSINIAHVDRILAGDKRISHILFAHIELSNGMLNPIKPICELSETYNCQIILDATNSFGGININFLELNIDYLVASPNHCLQAIAGLNFVIAKKSSLQKCQNKAKSYSLDLYAQWQSQQKGRWRFTCPVQVVCALQQALIELEEEGLNARALRYSVNQKLLSQGLIEQDFQPIINKDHQSTVITAFHAPHHKSYAFEHFYQLLKHQGYMIYHGAINHLDSFRIANIGNVYPADIKSLLATIEKCRYWLRE